MTPSRLIASAAGGGPTSSVLSRIPGKTVVSRSNMCCSPCCCLSTCFGCPNFGFLLNTPSGMLKIIELLLGGICQTMLMSFGPAQAQLIGLSFFSLLSANAAGNSVVTLLVLCYLFSKNSYALIRSSLFEVLFNVSAALSYLSASTYLAVAVNLFLYPVYLVTMGFFSYPAMVAAYTIGFALGVTHALDAYHSFRHFRGYTTT